MPETHGTEVMTKLFPYSQIQGKILTDLSIYRPGDTIGFMGVVYEVKEREMRQLPGTEVKMILCDANYQNADTLLLVSDKYGRVAGEVHPSGIRTARQLCSKMMNVSGDSREYGSVSVEVADYKSPTFFVTTDGTEDDYRIGDVVRIKGKSHYLCGDACERSIRKI